MYFDRITALLRGGGGANGEEQGLLNAAIGSLQTDAVIGELDSVLCQVYKYGSPNEFTKLAKTFGDDARD